MTALQLMIFVNFNQQFPLYNGISPLRCHKLHTLVVTILFIDSISKWTTGHGSRSFPSPRPSRHGHLAFSASFLYPCCNIALAKSRKSRVQLKQHNYIISDNYGLIPLATAHRALVAKLARLGAGHGGSRRREVPFCCRCRPTRRSQLQAGKTWLPDVNSRIFKIVCVWPFGLLAYGSATLRCKI